MTTVTLYSLSTGEFGRVLSCPGKALERNVPAGQAYKLGRFDKFSQRVDLETGEVVDYQPPSPGVDYEWRQNVADGRPRWVKTDAAAARDSAHSAAINRIDELERRQLRAMRELALGQSDAQPRLKAIDDEITSLRADLKQSVD